MEYSKGTWYFLTVCARYQSSKEAQSNYFASGSKYVLILS